MMELEDTNISKNKLMRNLEILKQVACGPITEQELQRLCFSKTDPATGKVTGVCSYSNMRRILKGLIKEGYLRRKKYLITQRPKKTQNVYVIGEAGIPDVVHHFGWEPEYIRRAFPKRSTLLLDEILLSGVIRTIINEEASTKRYRIDVLCDGGAYKKMFPLGIRKGLYVPDAYLSLLPRNPNIYMVSNKGRMELMFEIDTGRETGACWIKKLKSSEGHTVLLLSLNEKRKWELMGRLAKYKKLPNVFFAVYADFLQNGLTNTAWEHFDANGNRGLVKLPL